MQKEYKQAYFNLTKNTMLPLNCMPISKHKNSQSLSKLLQVNRTIMEIINPQYTTLSQTKKRNIITLQKSFDTDRTINGRIHHNIGHLSLKKQPYTNRTHNEANMNQHGAFDSSRSIEKANKTQIQKNRKDIYDLHIEKYIHTKQDNESIIEKYLTNREEFIKKACIEIETQIKKEGFGHRRSIDKLRQKRYKSRLPKIQEFSSHMLQKSNHKIRNGVYQQQLSHLKKASELQIKHRKRKQRVFRKKINSLQIRLDKLRFEEQV